MRRLEQDTAFQAQFAHALLEYFLTAPLLRDYRMIGCQKLFQAESITNQRMVAPHQTGEPVLEQLLLKERMPAKVREIAQGQVDSAICHGLFQLAWLQSQAP